MRQGLEPTIYHTPGEHANHYATDAVQITYIIQLWWQYRYIKSHM